MASGHRSQSQIPAGSSRGPRGAMPSWFRHANEDYREYVEDRRPSLGERLSKLAATVV
jgi:hypothetical protein